jgi:hypothetical protein
MLVEQKVCWFSNRQQQKQQVPSLAVEHLSTHVSNVSASKPSASELVSFMVKQCVLPVPQVCAVPSVVHQQLAQPEGRSLLKQ